MRGPWTDAHCHLADPRLESVLDSLIERSREAGVVSWIQGGVDPNDWQRQKALRAQLGDGLKLSFGLHPWSVIDSTDEQVDDALAVLESQLSDASAIGEIGMDTYRRRSRAPDIVDRQLRALIAQLQLAARVPRPLVLHVVRAHDLVLEQLEAHAPFSRGGIVHAFTGTAHDARRYVDLGFHLSLGGALVNNPSRARELAHIPVERVVVETDAPDQAPRAWQVQRNEPAFLPRIAEALAPVWGISGTELLDRAHITVNKLLSS